MLKITSRAIVLVTLAVAVVVGIASASEDLASRKIFMHDDDTIIPATLTMGHTETLEFDNYSGQFIRVVFVEPRDPSDRIRCSATDDHTSSMRFDWSAGRGLTATIPPGRFASTCSLVPGRYAFVATRVGRDPRGAESSLGTKGTIIVR
jgi:hypothetical protein